MNKELFERLIQTFRIEAAEHLGTITADLIQIERAASDEEQTVLLERMFRTMHSLKGASRAVNLKDIEYLCQNIEHAFAKLKNREMELSGELLDQFHHSLDLITQYLSASENDRIILADEMQILTSEFEVLSEKSTSRKETLPVESSPIIQIPPSSDQSRSGRSTDSHMISASAQTDTKKSIHIDRPIHSDSFRIPAERLDKLYQQSEELLSLKIHFFQILDDLTASQDFFTQWKKEWRRVNATLRSIPNDSRTSVESPENKKLNHLIDWFHQQSELIAQFEKRIDSVTKAAFQNTKEFGNSLYYLSADLKETMRLPLSSMADLLEKMVRDLAKDLKKEIDFHCERSQIEVDKRILEALKDPLIHLLRNAIDHGIESSEIRLSRSKPRKGKITLSFSQIIENHIEINVEDDGNGIDVPSLVESAVNKNILTPDESEALSEKDKLELIFRSGTSSSKVVTDISGRGLGMAIVKENINRIDGSITVHSVIGSGTRFIISLPVHIAAFRGIIVKTGDRQFIIPTVKAGRAQRIASEKIQKNETVDLIDFEGALIPLIRLDKLLDSNPHTAEDRDFPLIIILHDQEKKIALQVEEIQEENEMIIKPFNRQIEKIKYVSGASISAGGEIIPILDVKEIIQSAAQKSIPTLPEKSIIKKSLSILLVDDSVTSLMVMRDLLETAGHRVTSAHDGIEAHEKIANFNFDLVVSDVEMPRMNGFELTKKIKSEPAFRHIPVILVTGLSKPQYKTMGMNAGAQAFILKSTFNDQILLETINQLMDKQ